MTTTAASAARIETTTSGHEPAPTAWTGHGSPPLPRGILGGLLTLRSGFVATGPDRGAGASHPSWAASAPEGAGGSFGAVRLAFTLTTAAYAGLLCWSLWMSLFRYRPEEGR